MYRFCTFLMQSWDYSRDKLLPETASHADLVACTLEEAKTSFLGLENDFVIFFTTFWINCKKFWVIFFHTLDRMPISSTSMIADNCHFSSFWCTWMHNGCWFAIFMKILIDVNSKRSLNIFCKCITSKLKHSQYLQNI